EAVMVSFEGFTQSEYIDRLIRDQTPCTVIFMNGYQLACAEFLTQTSDAVLMKAPGFEEQMVYKHAISTVRPPHPLYEEKPPDDNDLPF
ncbi:MAG: RNA chaperone Hfq, partial [Oscillibacter sp.]|nr:RNA chaperone Hfq [Oscillibacter sp.]